VVVDGLVVPGVVAVLVVVVIARVTVVMRALWLSVSACWCRWICCWVGAVRSALRQALISASDGVDVLAVVVGVGVAVDVGVPVGVEPLVDVEVGVGVVVAEDAEAVGEGADVVGEGADVVGEAVEVVDSDGKNGAHCASAADARRRSAVMARCALVTRCWAWARPVPAPLRPDGPVTRGLVVGATVATGVETGVVAVARELPLELPVPPLAVSAVVAVVAFVVVLWSDSRVALALARDALAEMTAPRSGTGSRVANASPAVTVSPTATFTLETVPVTAKPWLAWLTRWADPVRLRRCSTEPMVTVVVR